MAGKLALSDSNRVLTYRAIVNVLRGNPDLSRVVQDWKVWEGSQSDVAEPNTKKLPYLRVTPVSTPSEFSAIDVSLCPVSLRLEYLIDGTNVDDLLNLDDAVRVALFPGDGSVSRVLQGLRTASGSPLSNGPIPKLWLRQLVEFQADNLSGSRVLRGVSYILWKEYVASAN